MTESLSAEGISNASKKEQFEMKEKQDQSNAQQTIMYKSSDIDKPKKIDNADFDFE
jgi:hypothetical protein